MIVNALRQLWQEAFSEPDDFTDLFFTTGYSPNRCHYVAENGLPVSALYWFDCALDGHKFAYIYGVATLKSHRGKGFATKLMDETHEILRNRGYSGVLLVPEKASLFDFYRKLDYCDATTVAEFTCTAADTPFPLQQIGANEYAHLRKHLLPKGAPVLSDALLDFMGSYCRFYAGEDFLLAGEFIHGHLVTQEFLGNIDAAPGIVRALGCEKGHFRTPGKERILSMFLPLAKNCPAPTYFAPALD